MSKKSSKRNGKGKQKMTVRKPLPYHATQNIDEALMASTEALNLVHNMFEHPQSMQEHFRLLGLVLIEINQSITALNNIER